MISKKHRFHGHGALSFLYRNGKTIRSEMVNLRFHSGKNDDFRMAVVVSKKVSKSAVVRNRIRRRLYEFVREVHKAENKKWPTDMALIVFSENLATMSSVELNNLISRLLKKAKII